MRANVSDTAGRSAAPVAYASGVTILLAIQVVRLVSSTRAASHRGLITRFSHPSSRDRIAAVTA
jgi:hypothetical protein